MYVYEYKLIEQSQSHHLTPFSEDNIQDFLCVYTINFRILARVFRTTVLFCFLVTPINQFLIILGRCTLYTPVCLQDEPTCMRIEPV